MTEIVRLSAKEAFRERPVLFSADMVRAILEGRKTQTRRVVKGRLGAPHPSSNLARIHVYDGRCVAVFDTPAEHSIGRGAKATTGWASTSESFPCPYGAPGDRLWVRETWADADRWTSGYSNDEPHSIAYRADLTARFVYSHGRLSDPLDTYAWNWDLAKWRPSIHMPRWASRIRLVIKGIRVEPLGDISESDARAESCGAGWEHSSVTPALSDFRELWDQINEKRAPWASNPWVWVVEFAVDRPG